MAKKMLIPQDVVVAALTRFGYLKPGEAVTPKRLSAALKAYQDFNGLKSDGVLGPRTARKLTNPYRCGMPDFIGDDDCQWPHKDVTYRSVLTLPGLSESQTVEAADVAARQINEVCGLRLARVMGNANIMARSGRGRADGLDGRSGTLGYAYLPCGQPENGSVKVVFDADEAWNFSMAVAVICHEFLHAVGIPHLQEGNLMAPYYRADITKPQVGDIRELQRRYGKPSSEPLPPVVPVPGGNPLVEVAVIVNGQRYVASGKTKPAPAAFKGCDCSKVKSSKRRVGTLS